MHINKVKGHAAMIVANMAWGLMAPFVKTVVLKSNINAWTIVAFRVMGAALAFWTASLFIPKEKIPFKDLKWLVLAALFGIILNQGVFVLGVSYTSPINASIVTTTLPIVAMIIAAFYLKEPITWKKLVGIVIGAMGALIIIMNSSSGNVSGDVGFIGILLCFMAQLSYAIYFVFFKNIISRYSPITLMKWMFLFSSVIYLPLTWSQLSTLDYQNMPSSIIGELAFIVLGSTFLSYMMIPIAQKYLRPTVATMYNNVQPIVASIAAVLLQIDHFGWFKVLAILLVFSGVYMVTTSKAKEQASEDDQ